jgi:hypothetical protein
MGWGNFSTSLPNNKLKFQDFISKARREKAEAA